MTYDPDVMLVVMAVDDISSLETVNTMLCYLKETGLVEDKTVLLVANKADLVRNRVVKTSG